ncbi:hypothetical protein J6590_021469 [Homalodisca vitripennis]|nr:hypothetical protein J6590_021469 [Homalodisca vitripennis]
MITNETSQSVQIENNKDDIRNERGLKSRWAEAVICLMSGLNGEVAAGLGHTAKRVDRDCLAKLRLQDHAENVAISSRLASRLGFLNITPSAPVIAFCSTSALLYKLTF